MFCPKCGTDLSSYGSPQFCPICGYHLQEKETGPMGQEGPEKNQDINGENKSSYHDLYHGGENNPASSNEWKNVSTNGGKSNAQNVSTNGSNPDAQNVSMNGSNPNAQGERINGGNPYTQNGRVNGGNPNPYVQNGSSNSGNPYAQNGRVNSGNPYTQNGRVNGGNPNVQNGPVNGGNPYAQNGSVNGGNPYAQNGRVNGGNPNVQNGPVNGGNPYAQNGSVNGGNPYAQNGHMNSGNPYTQNGRVYSGGPDAMGGSANNGSGKGSGTGKKAGIIVGVCAAAVVVVVLALTLPRILNRHDASSGDGVAAVSADSATDSTSGQVSTSSALQASDTDENVVDANSTSDEDAVVNADSTGSDEETERTDSSSEGAASSESATSSSASSASSDTGITASVDPEVVSQASSVIDQMTQAVRNNDYDTFRSLFTSETTDDTVQSEFDALQSGYLSFQKTNVMGVGTFGDYRLVQAVYYITADQGGSSSYQSASINWLFKNVNGSWLVDESQTALDSFNQAVETIYRSYVPEEAAAAADAGRNFTACFTNVMYADSSMVFEGCNATETIFLWQQENGDVCAALWLANGTDQNMYYSSGDLTVTDDSLGEVINTSFDLGQIIPAQSSIVYTVTIPASEVKTGTAQWGTVSCNLQCYYPQ